MRAPFITFEGGDGVGKSTQVKALADRLAARGLAVVATREPGGAPGADKLRALLVSGDADDWSPISEALLMYAARAEHLRATINPARAKGAVVLCDRFADSTMAYQGIAGAVGREPVARLYDMVVGDDGPDMTLVFDLAEDEGLARAAARGATADARADEARFENKGGAYQARVRAAFLEIARGAPQRCRIIDAAGPQEAVAARVDAAVAPLLGGWADYCGRAGGADG